MSDLASLPYARQWVDEGDMAAVAAVLQGDWLTTGPAVELFEHRFAETVRAREAVAVSSGNCRVALCFALPWSSPWRRGDYSCSDLRGDGERCRLLWGNSGLRRR